MPAALALRRRDRLDANPHTAFLGDLRHLDGTHRRAGRIADALKPGGLVVIEGFADPPNGLGFKADELANAFGRLRVLRNETVTEEADWAPGEKRPIVRFVAQKDK